MECVTFLVLGCGRQLLPSDPIPLYIISGLTLQVSVVEKRNAFQFLNRGAPFLTPMQAEVLNSFNGGCMTAPLNTMHALVFR